MKRAGGIWSVFDGPPEHGRKIGTAATIAEAKAHAETHAAGGRLPDPPARRAKPPGKGGKGGSVVAAARAVRVSPTTAAKIAAARDAMPTDADGWHQAALLKPDPAEIAKLKKASDAATKTHDRNVAALDAIRAQYRADTLTAMKNERDKGLHTRWRNGVETPLSDAEIESLVERSALNLHTPQFERAQKKAIASLKAWTNAEGNYEDAMKGQLLPRTADGLPMPSAELSAHLDRALEVGRAVLADAKTESERTVPPSVRAAQQHIAEWDGWAGALAETDRAYDTVLADGKPATVTTPDGRVHQITDHRQARDLEGEIRRELFTRRDVTRLSRKSVAYHEQQVLRGLLDSARPMGGIHHSNATAETDTSPGVKANGPAGPRGDWRQRLTDAEDMFPRAWLAVHAGRPLTVGASRRAYYDPANNHLSLSTPDEDHTPYEGGFKDKTGEVAVHEMGHRMEQYIPGLTALEFTMVRRRATAADGTVQKIERLPGYSADEKGQVDEWGRPYAGKTYEGPWSRNRGPHETAWEVFQVGLQDTFGRDSNPYGRKSDPEELQAFVLGALLTLGR